MRKQVTLYDTLGVERDASDQDIRKAFRRLALKHHPDRGGCTKKMQEVNSEYEKLFKEFKESFNNDPSNKYKKSETVEMYKDFINQIIHLEEIDI